MFQLEVRGGMPTGRATLYSGEKLEASLSRRRRSLPGPCELGEQFHLRVAAFRSTGNEMRQAGDPLLVAKRKVALPVTKITLLCLELGRLAAGRRGGCVTERPPRCY